MNRTSPNSVTCGNDVQFHEFLQFITTELNGSSNPHWNPITKICKPCSVKYNFNIKLESFVKDKADFFEQMGIKKDIVLENNKMSHDYFISSMADLIGCTIKHISGRSKKECYKKKLIFSKLFSAFQIQGYIHRDAVFNAADFANATILRPETVVSVFRKYITINL
uniref:Carbohydrate sulfotransferase n=1 Tax=Octopus bimaculoides TaxID=37653 RepID=A0A0L8H4D1_OCTBM